MKRSRGDGGGDGDSGDRRHNTTSSSSNTRVNMSDARSVRRRLGPAASAMQRNQHNVFRDYRESTDQVSTDSLLRDAAAMQRFHAPSTKGASARLLIYSIEELALYRQKHRAEMDEKVKRGYSFLGNWIKYARWEAAQDDFARMRAILQRAVAFHGDDPAFWRDYAELEAANGFVAEARAVWGRAVTALPASTDLWLKYLVFEQAAAGPASASEPGGGGGGGGAGSFLGGSSSSSSTGGGEATIRDVFNRWLAVPTAVPAAAYELYALFEAQRGRRDACRDVLRRFVERYNTPAAWLFCAQSELGVFGDGARAVRVLETALDALPAELLYGPLECRVPLALAETLAAVGRVEEARQRYHSLLGSIASSGVYGGGDGGEVSATVVDESDPVVAAAAASVGTLTTTVAVKQPGTGSSGISSGAVAFELVDDVLAAYGRFERLHADAVNYARLSQLEAQKALERRLVSCPADFDAWLSLYLILREATTTAASSSGSPNSATSSSSPSSLESSKEALRCLSRALATPAESVANDPYAAQQRAVLVMEYARHCEARGDIEAARAALTEGIRGFPFDQAACPRLWLEASAFEERRGDLDTARTLLSAGLKLSKSDDGGGGGGGTTSSGGAALAESHTNKLLFGASLRLEQRAAERGVCTHADGLAAVRRIYTEAIRSFPLDATLWLGFAQLEEAEGQPARAQALYAACIRALTAEAGKTRSFAHRYVLLGRVDAAWARRLSLQSRLSRRLRSAAAKLAKKSKKKNGAESGNGIGDGGDGEVAAAGAAAAAEKELKDLYVALLRSLLSDYTFEALAWRSTYLAAAPLPPAATDRGRGDNREGEGGDGTTDAEDKAAAAAAAEAQRRCHPSVPAALPDALDSACARLADAVSAVLGFILASPTPTAVAAAADGADADANADAAAAASDRALAMRAVFAGLISDETALLKRTLGWTAETSFDAAQSLSAWVDLLLSPMTRKWAAFEAAHGGSVAVVQQQTAAAAAPKRRTRLLRNRN